MGFLSRYKATSVNFKPIRKMVFWPPFIILMLLLILGIIERHSVDAVLKNTMQWVFNCWGWLYMFGGFAFTVICLGIMLSPAGNIKFGGKDAEPEFSKWQWFAISLCTGMGIGITYWAVVEPMAHLTNFPQILSIKPNTAASAMFALRTVFFHWTLTPYSMYVLFGITIAYAYYNKKLPFCVASGLYPVIGEKRVRKWGRIIDAITLFSICGAVAHSLGLGVLQLSGGIGYITGYTSLGHSHILWAFVTLFLILAYTTSSYTGIKRGIAFLSDNNMKLFIILMIFAFVTGPAAFIMKTGTQAFGSFLNNFIPMSFRLGAVNDDSWVTNWTLFYWGVWLSFAPMVGMFLARLVYGRTVRDFIIYNLIFPSLFIGIWFAIFGGDSLFLQFNGVDMHKLIAEKGAAMALYVLLEYHPFALLTQIIAAIVCTVSFITCADSMTTTVATISTSGHTVEDPEPPANVKLGWGIIMGGLALLGIVSGGVEALKNIGVISGLPILFIEIAAAVSVCMILTKAVKAKEDKDL
ncbi:MAG: BCCT family transporter [Victivallales bacterium]|nr:BCCT family transporter [Victivallales bacterium]